VRGFDPPPDGGQGGQARVEIVLRPTHDKVPHSKGKEDLRRRWDEGQNPLRRSFEEQGPPSIVYNLDRETLPGEEINEVDFGTPGLTFHSSE
jgi:hypothetical protein